MNRRTARTTADSLEVMSVFLDVIREEKDEAGEKTFILNTPSVEASSYLSEVNERLSKIESPCVALPPELSSLGISLAAKNLSDEEREKRENIARRTLGHIAKCRGTLCGKTTGDIETMSAEDLEVLRAHVCSTENHGVSFFHKCLYMPSGASDSFQYDSETQAIFEFITKIGRGSYQITLSDGNEEGMKISKRISDLREMATAEETAKKKKEKADEEYIQKNVEVRKNTKAKAKAKRKAKTKTKKVEKTEVTVEAEKEATA